MCHTRKKCDTATQCHTYMAQLAQEGGERISNIQQGMSNVQMGEHDAPNSAAQLKLHQTKFSYALCGDRELFYKFGAGTGGEVGILERRDDDRAEQAPGVR